MELGAAGHSRPVADGGLRPRGTAAVARNVPRSAQRDRPLGRDQAVAPAGPDQGSTATVVGRYRRIGAAPQVRGSGGDARAVAVPGGVFGTAQHRGANLPAGSGRSPAGDWSLLLYAVRASP